MGFAVGAVLLGALLAAPQATAVCSVPPNQIGITGHWERDARRAGISPDNMVLVTSQVNKDSQNGIRAWYYECENTCVYHGVSHDDWCDPSMFVCSGTLEKVSESGSKLISSGASWQQMAEVNAAIKAGGCHPKCPIACTHTGALAPPAPPIKDAIMTEAEARVGDSAEAHENDGPDPFGDDMSNAPPHGNLPAESPAPAAAAAASADAPPADPADPDGPDGPEKAIIPPVLEEQGVDATPAIDAAVETVNPDKVATSPAIGDAMLVNALMDDKNTPPSDADPTLLNSLAENTPGAGDAKLVNALLDDTNAPPTDADPTLLNMMGADMKSSDKVKAENEKDLAAEAASAVDAVATEALATPESAGAAAEAAKAVDPDGPEGSEEALIPPVLENTTSAAGDAVTEEASKVVDPDGAGPEPAIIPPVLEDGSAPADAAGAPPADDTKLHAEAEQAVDAVANTALNTPVAAGAAAEAAAVVDPDGPEGSEKALIPPVLEDTTPAAGDAVTEEASKAVDPDGPGPEPAIIPPVLEEPTAAGGAGASAVRRSRRLLFN